MTQALELPLHMRRNGLDPAGELALALLRRFPALALAEDRPAFRASSIVYGLHRLRVTW